MTKNTVKLCLLMAVLANPASCSAWQLAGGGGLLAGLAPETAFGWQFTGQWTRETYAGWRWLVDLDVGQYGTQAAPNAWLMRGREQSLLVLWERRVPFGYAFRPWIGIGGGVSHYRFDERQLLNGGGYAIASYPAITRDDGDLAASMTVPLGHSWSLAITAETGFPTRTSTVSMTVLWRLF
ncbi:hypothetical protein [Acidiferrobacter sp.]|uniref:hypothetical protein n=1 Tax=Acidiferrobacter sp. TaxID=1872107 RepID=UPI002603FA38|nr:hypothetical protein [Acidiferrobacter sp.]